MSIVFTSLDNSDTARSNTRPNKGELDKQEIYTWHLGYAIVLLFMCLCVSFANNDANVWIKKSMFPNLFPAKYQQFWAGLSKNVYFIRKISTTAAIWLLLSFSQHKSLGGLNMPWQHSKHPMSMSLLSIDATNYYHVSALSNTSKVVPSEYISFSMVCDIPNRPKNYRYS